MAVRPYIAQRKKGPAPRFVMSYCLGYSTLIHAAFGWNLAGAGATFMTLGIRVFDAAYPHFSHQNMQNADEAFFGGKVGDSETTCIPSFILHFMLLIALMLALMARLAAWSRALLACPNFQEVNVQDCGPQG